MNQSSNLSTLNCDVESILYNDYTQIFSLRISLVIVWIIMTIVTFFGNLLVVVAVIKCPALRTVTNYYLTNMAIVDMLIAVIVMPFKLIELVAPCEISIEIFNKNICMASQYIFMTLVHTSMLTVVIISFERYLAIVYPMKVHLFHRKQRIGVILLVNWALPLLINIPSMIYQDISTTQITNGQTSITRIMCYGNFPKHILPIIIWFYFLGFFLVPLLCVLYTSIRITCQLLYKMSPVDRDVSDKRHITYNDGSTIIADNLSTQKSKLSFHRSIYSHSIKKHKQEVGSPSIRLKSTHGPIKWKHHENKRKVAKMIIVVTILYCLSWSPFYITQIVAVHTEFLIKYQFFFTFTILLLISFVNSAANPIVYYFMSQKIRNAMTQIIHNSFMGFYKVLCHKKITNHDELTHTELHNGIINNESELNIGKTKIGHEMTQYQTTL